VHDEGDLRAVPAGAQDPVTGEETVVFSCFNQDQPLDMWISAACARGCRRTASQEKLTKLWIDRCRKAFAQLAVLRPSIFETHGSFRNFPHSAGGSGAILQSTLRIQVIKTGLFALSQPFGIGAIRGTLRALVSVDGSDRHQANRQRFREASSGNGPRPRSVAMEGTTQGRFG
jgi:hypothetical protein